MYFIIASLGKNCSFLHFAVLVAGNVVVRMATACKTCYETSTDPALSKTNSGRVSYCEQVRKNTPAGILGISVQAGSS